MLIPPLPLFASVLARSARRILEPEISLAVRDLLKPFGDDRADLLVRDIADLLLDQRIADPLRFGCGVILKVLLESHQRVRVAAVLDLAALAKAHEAVAGTALAVAGGAEGGDMPGFHQPADDFIERALVGNVELLGVVRSFIRTVSGIAAN